MATAKKSATVKRAAGKKAATTKRGSGDRGRKSAGAMPKAGKDPRGGLTAEGRAFFAKTEGAHLRPGVKGPADTPEKMVRKGSFLRRHFANPRGPMMDEGGQPTRLALSAQAWGEPLPKTPRDARRLADKGHQLLEKYHQVQGDAPKAKAGGRPPVTAAAKRAVVKKAVAKKAVAKKAVAKKSAGRKATAKKTAARKTAAR